MKRKRVAVDLELPPGGGRVRTGESEMPWEVLWGHLPMRQWNNNSHIGSAGETRAFLSFPTLSLHMFMQKSFLSQHSQPVSNAHMGVCK